ncbi:MAG: ATP-binding protein [Acidobacteria bacterium]|nr:ATP-binding protein [Acidobacteriota bacterium]MCI0623394.1 ATP-binding protein [Acidobacteriota bacterium]MCI0724204.1 ATP-binding protein [Acidobacteriota bacterium]
MFHTVAEQDFGLKILNSLRCGILSVDLQRRITAINEIAIRIFELDAQNYVGMDVEVVLSDQPQLLQTLNDAYQMKNLPSRAELDLRLRDGKNRTVGYTISFIKDLKDEDGTVDGVSLFFKDLTLVEQLNEQEKLKDRLAALGQMAAGLAHEIRNPLAAIELTASLIKRKMNEQPTHTAQLESIQSEVRKLNKIVTDCLEFVRPVKVSPEKVNLKSLLEESLGNALSTVDREGIEIMKSYQETPAVPIDYTQMKQVFVNILVNAMQALGKKQGRIQIACGPSVFFERTASSVHGKVSEKNLSRQVDLAPYAWVRVEDNGQGIPDEVLSKIFYPFFTTKEKGSGIGLAIAQKIIDSHHGSIDVESEVGRGTVFTIKLPLRETSS